VTSVRKTLKSRRLTTPILEAASERIQPIALQLRDDFTTQNAFINDNSRYIAAQCSRRAGKTNGLAIRFFNTMLKHPKSRCIYLALTLDSAMDIMWPVLHEINDYYKLGCTFIDSRHLVIHPNGSQLRLYGADMKNFIKRLKGKKSPGIGIDEAQDFGTHLQSLIDDVLTPSIADYSDGWLALTGTPGPVPQGYFFDVTQQHKYGYSIHKWDLMQNPFMPNPKDFLTDLKAKREWLDDNPTLRREWLNQWVLDQKALWVQYDENTNHYQKLPDDKPYDWHYILGVDIGFNDADAIAVLAWSEKSNTTYLVEEIIQPKQGISALFTMIETAQKKYNAYKIVMDQGALGKKIAEDLIPRFQVPFVPAEKHEKQTYVELLNDELRRGRFKAKGNSRFAQDSYLIQIDWDKSTPNKIVIKKKPHSDIIDAVIYAFRDSYGYIHQEEKPKPKPGTKEWADLQSTEMWERELEGFSKAAEHMKWVNGDWD
jgi:hypothetical protein